ncbi:hypothetical protein [Pseudoxanthomonas sp. Root630]|uniref:hypothetical protein n=1 Tax=Pseudoxanthomonas sp. Root630 TaxID=1736574 RepID=UPI000702D444|nr:hypothetical protein [Pseudoxanthomonas sp. Root630]KRA48745.1 hypothetical protein ASD72_19485 [Pseudoxanthomonas sp. Root630]
MPARHTLLGLALACLAVPAGANADILRQEARAYARKGDTLLYRESHWRYRQDGLAHRLVLYRCPDGRAFARKTVVERASAQAPDFDFEDARDGYREGVRSGPRGRSVYVRTSADATTRERAIALPAGGVIDAGFDASVRLHWDALRAGREVDQPFLLPSRMAYVPVSLRPGAAVRWQGIPAQRLTMRLDRWYGFIAPTMQLTYADADQRLLEFAGIATIRDAAGKHQDVRIVFPDPPTPAGADALRQARATPLVRTCGR